MIQMFLLPGFPSMAEAILEYLAFGVLKLSALGLPMLSLHRFGDMRRQQLQVRPSVQHIPLALDVFCHVG